MSHWNFYGILCDNDSMTVNDNLRQSNGILCDVMRWWDWDFSGMGLGFISIGPSQSGLWRWWSTIHRSSFGAYSNSYVGKLQTYQKPVGLIPPIVTGWWYWRSWVQDSWCCSYVFNCMYSILYLAEVIPMIYEPLANHVYNFGYINVFGSIS